MIYTVDWDELEKNLAFLSKYPLLVDDDRRGAIIINDKRHIVAMVDHKSEDRLIVAFRASLRPNISVLIASAITSTGYSMNLGNSFEVGHSGDFLYGEEALAFLVENASELILNKKEPSKESTKVRPRTGYVKHRLN